MDAASPEAKRIKMATPPPPVSTDQSERPETAVNLDTPEMTDVLSDGSAASSPLLFSVPSSPPPLTPSPPHPLTSPDCPQSKEKVFRQSKLSFHSPSPHHPPPSTPSPLSSDVSPPSPLEIGTHLSELCFGPSAFPTLLTLPTLTSSQHCVLFNAKTIGHASFPPKPYPDSFKDVWDYHHVRMPCSAQNLYPVATGDANSEKKLLPRWDMICKALRQPISSSQDLESAILSYNYQYSKRWKFKTLHSYFQLGCTERERMEFFSNILPKIVALALDLPRIVTHALPLLKQQQAYSVSLSQQQIGCLLANAFLCTFPRRNATKPASEYSNYPTINWSLLFCGGGARDDGVRFNKLKCLIHYLHRVTTSVPVGVVTFARQLLPSPPPQWGESGEGFTQLCVEHTGTIEDNGAGMLQVDFANRFLGGGVLGDGCVQEEIRFLISPELLVSRLFTECLAANESVVVTGAERYSNYSGYAASFEWQGRHDDATVRDVWGRRQTQVVAIDALIFRSTSAQFKPGVMCRELNKAYCGFRTTETTPCGRGMAVATGNWGCGAFGGNLRLKALLQLMAASLAGRDVMFFTFGDRQLRQDLVRLHRSLVCEGVTVGRVWRVLLRCQDELDPRGDLYGFVLSALGVASGNSSQATLEYSVEGV